MTDPDDKQQPAGETHTGYDLESGVLARAREWTDVFPWMRLSRTLRVAGSPVMLGLVAITLILWWNVHGWLLSASAIRLADVEGATNPASNAAWQPTALQSLLGYAKFLFPIALFDSAIVQSDWQPGLLAMVWALIAWMPVTLFLVRQGALLTAGRNLMSAEAGVRRSLRLTPTGWLIAFVPLACVLVFGLMILIVGWMAQLVEGITVLELPLVLLVALIAIPCGLLGFGSYIAAPLGWAALANEQAPDSLDALSRGYEYLYRRPLQVVLYSIISTVILIIMTAIASAIARVAGAVAVATLNTSGASTQFSGLVTDTLQFYPVVVAVTLFWALVGGVYLLLRRDAGEQEVEDLWQPAPKPKQPLPELQFAGETNA